jgi:hypothetical protein
MRFFAGDGAGPLFALSGIPDVYPISVRGPPDIGGDQARNR